MRPIYLAAEIDEMLELLRRLVTSVYDVGHVRSEDKRRSIAFETAEPLCIAQKLAEIDVKKMPRRLHHDVVVVAIANT